MLCETIDLYAWAKLPRKGAKAGYLKTYRHEQTGGLAPRIRPAMLVIAGGGYEFVSPREMEPVAMEYFHAGFDAFVLDYDVAPVHYPAQLLEAGMAMLYLRRHAEELAIEKIAAIGFSAGGHLCGCLALLWDDPALKAAFGEDCARIRPDCAVLAYPVVSADERVWHGGSFTNFCGDAVPHAQYSLEQRARPDAAPCFIWTAAEDDCVPAENSLRLFTALHRAGASAELHIFEHGWHGVSMCTEETNDDMPPFMAHVGHWVGLSIEFLRGHGCVCRRA